jgi:methyl acetate hydrolase
MQLIERSKLKLEQPASELVAELASPQVLEGFDVSGQPRLRPARRPITVRHLLTHTAGFTYDIWCALMGQYQTYASIPGISTCQNAALITPLLCDPGERWEYGISIDWLGKIVEAVQRPAPRSLSCGAHLPTARHARHRLPDFPIDARTPGSGPSTG